MSSNLPLHLARAFESSVRYAADAAPSELTALVEATRDGDRKGDYLPHKVLADYLEENPHLIADEIPTRTLRRLRHDHERDHPPFVVAAENGVKAINYLDVTSRLHSPEFRRVSGRRPSRFFPAGVDASGDGEQYGHHVVTFQEPSEFGADPHNRYTSPAVEFASHEDLERFLRTGQTDHGRQFTWGEEPDDAG